MLLCLSTLSGGGYEYFHKSFRPVRRTVNQLNLTVDNSDGFFTDLPQSKSKSKKSQVVNTKQQQQAAQYERLQSRKRAATVAIEALERQMGHAGASEDEEEEDEYQAEVIAAELQ